MILERKVYSALENVVGETNISEDPVILDSYAFQLNAELSQGGSKYFPRPIAVLLPGSTEEVQDIVKICNKYNIKYKAHSTGWGSESAIKAEGIIQLDMRRMDHILEIDEKNMIAVVEPYVIGVTLQAEAMKRGLNCHIIGAGSSCSILASATSFMGTSPDCLNMGHSSQNLLALEWVMPDGSILRTGSLDSSQKWFCGEGPGPSVRGIARGWAGAMGGLGVFTRCAVRLHPWPGPKVMPVEGTIPAYNSPLPDNFRAYTVACPTWQAYADTLVKIYDAEIGYTAHRQFTFFGADLQAAMLNIITDHTKTLEDLEPLLENPEIQKLTEELRISFQIVLAGNSARDIEFQDKALDEILSETGSWKVAALATPAMQRYLLLYLLRLCFKNLNFVYAGGYASSFSRKGTPDWVASVLVPLAIATIEEHQKRGFIVDSGADSMMGGLSDMAGGGRTWMEQFSTYDTHDKNSIKGEIDYIKAAVEAARLMNWPPSYDAAYVESGDSDAESSKAKIPWNQLIALQWQRKVKEAIDPNNTSDGSYASA